MHNKWIAAPALALTFAVTASADESAAQEGQDTRAADVLVEQLHQGAVIERYVAQVVGRLRSADRRNDGLGRDDVALAHSKDWARARANAVNQVLPSDLDGDFEVTRTELAQTARTDARFRDKQVEAQLNRFDADGNGTITLTEAAAAAQAPNGNAELAQLIALDPDRDGTLTPSELEGLAKQAFKSVDGDADGMISAEEYTAIAERVREIRRLRYVPACKLPPVPEGAELVMYGGYESDALSSAAVGGQDKETNFIDVKIEEGSEPLYLVLTSYESMIWRLRGATDRVTRAVVTSHMGADPKQVRQASSAPDTTNRRIPIAAPAPPPRDQIAASGIIGLPASKITIAGVGCPRPFHESTGEQAKRAATSVERALARAPDAVFGSYSAQAVSLPSGTITQAEAAAALLPTGFDATMWREAIRFWPGGLVTVDPRDVVAKTSVEPYKVLPSQMGLAQLIGSGAIEALENGKFRITRPIPRLPPSMGGAHSVTFLLAAGVPLPPGDPVHSCVLAEHTGQVVRAGARCARHMESIPSAPPVVRVPTN